MALRLHPLPAVARTAVIDGARWRWLHRSQLAPSAVDLHGGELHVLFEGGARAVDAQLRALGGEERDSWAAIRELQATLPGRRRWTGDEAPLVRPGPAVAYVEQATDERWSALAERVTEAMWTPS
jgi:hypothetical protein